MRGLCNLAQEAAIVSCSLLAACAQLHAGHDLLLLRLSFPLFLATGLVPCLTLPRASRRPPPQNLGRSLVRHAACAKPVTFWLDLCAVYSCNRACQKRDWALHRSSCGWFNVQ